MTKFFPGQWDKEKGCNLYNEQEKVGEQKRVTVPWSLSPEMSNSGSQKTQEN